METLSKYQEIEKQINILLNEKKEIEKLELESAKNDGWNVQPSGFVRDFISVELRNVDMVVIDAEPIAKNELKFTLLCVNGAPDFHMKRFIYTVYLTNKHMLASKFKRGDLFNVHLLKAYSEIQTRKLLSGMVVYKEKNMYVVNGLYVKKPGRK